MKPKLFIGSSVEGIDIANSIQENLEYDAEVTVWNQGVFELSSNTIDDLLKHLDITDFGIFIFSPDDMARIRNKDYKAVRDNVIFELGLFIGRLGKGFSFYLIPRNSENLRLPTDLIGLAPGTYDSNRVDGNLKAATGVFCNQVRLKMKTFSIRNLKGLDQEEDNVLKILRDRKPYWAYYFACQMLDNKIDRINKRFGSLSKGFIPFEKESVTGEEFFLFFSDSLSTHQHLLQVIMNSAEELSNAILAKDETQKPLEIKYEIDRIIDLCEVLYQWELKLAKMTPPIGLERAKRMIQGWSKNYLNQINAISEAFKEGIKNESGLIELKLEFKVNSELLLGEFRNYFNLNK